MTSMTGILNLCFLNTEGGGTKNKKSMYMNFTQRWAPDVARQDTGYKLCEVQEKGKGKVKVKGDMDGHRQWAWTQTDDRFINTRQET
jgi:hypothetical protein